MPDLFYGLNEEQRKCAEATEGAVLVLAGAGSGKTRVLTHRIAGLIKNNGVKPYNILAITFTNKAANEMRERLEKMLGGVEEMWVCTIHGMCNRILRRCIDLIGYGKSFTIYSEDDKERVLKRIITDMFGKDDLEVLLKEAKYYISNAKNNNMEPSAYSESGFDSKNFDRVIRIYSAYEAELKKCNALDFDDLILKTYKLFTESKESLEYFSRKFMYIHIDEFQDTSVVQYNLIKILASCHKNIFAVGDDDQSIYGWRGAEVENIFRFQQDFEGTRVFKLQRNYRSTKKILSLANCIIKNNTMRMEKELWTENSDGVRAEKHVAGDENGEAYYVASMIRSLMTYNGYSASDFAVLVRLNALSNPFEKEFMKYGLSYKIFGGFKFFERKEVKDIIAYLRLIVNPFDEESLLRIINFPKRGIGDSAITAMRKAAQENGLPLWDIVLKCEKIKGLPPAIVKKLAAFKEIAKDILQSSEIMPKDEFIKHVVSVTGINAAYAEETEENVNRRLNVGEFVNSFMEYFKDNPESELDDYLASVTLVSDIDQEEEQGGVTIATIHSVKGLEFKVVFICGLEDGMFPMSRAYNEPKELEEERRLMYVAITRARERLFLTRANSRFLYGDRKLTLESKFLKELSEFFETKPEREYIPKDSYDYEERSGYQYSERGRGFGGGAYGGGYGNYGSFGGKEKTASRGFASSDRQSQGASKIQSIASKPFGAASGASSSQNQTEKDFSAYTAGRKIYHDKFGEGVIIKVSGSGSAQMADIAFPKIGVKTFTLKFAPVKLL